MARGGARRSVVEWTPANVVTMVRICLIPAFLVLLLAPWSTWWLQGDAATNLQAFVVLGVFALISLTDSLDGYLARSRNEVTVFGKFMDPIADKVLVIAALVALVELDVLPSWVSIVVIVRELLVSGLRMLVASAGVVVAANWIGKAKTLTTMVAICMFLIDGAPALSFAQPWFHDASWVLMGTALVLTVASMVDYFAKSWPLLAGENSHDKTPPQASADDGVSGERSGSVSKPLCVESSLEGAHPIARVVLERAAASSLKVATAESCTGGLVAAALTSVPGSSAVVLGGTVAYDPSVKEAALGVEPRVIADHGVVSIETAAQMASGARERFNVDFAVSTTGIAGPGGAEPGKPVGTVCFAVAGPREVRVERRVFTGDRIEVRAQAVDVALDLLASALADERGE